MSRSFRLVNGDLGLAGPTVDTVSGTQKLLQDLDCWLRERFQVDRFHRGYGSTLDMYIGGVIDNDTTLNIESEVYRVLGNYQNLQLQRVTENPERYSPAELLDTVLGVRATLYYDRVNVAVSIVTAARQQAQLQVRLTA